jgi:hypothetical protein
MSNISPKLLNQAYEILPRCGPFSTDISLRAIFVDSRISTWREALPQASSPVERVQLTIDFLVNQSNASNENAFVLFLRVLSERFNPSDSCHRKLIELANEIQKATAKHLSSVSILTSKKIRPDIQVSTDNRSGGIYFEKEAHIKGDIVGRDQNKEVN